MKKKQTLCLIDGMAYLFRAFYALPPLNRKSDNTPLGAISGFCNILFKLLASDELGVEFTSIAVIFDRQEKTFRKEIYNDYKANRGPPPDDLIPQFSIVRDAVKAFNVVTIDKAGYEADDIIATLAKQASKQDMDVVILSSDKDLMQLVSDKIYMYDGMKNSFIKEEQVIEKFGVKPNRVVDVQALCGDSSDNIPGVPKIGIKTGSQLIAQYGDLENLLKNAHEIKQKMRRENLINFAEQARLSYKLALLKDDVSLDITLDDLVRKQIDNHRLITFLQEMEFKQLISRVKVRAGLSEQKNNDQQATSSKYNYQLITSEDNLVAYLDKIANKLILAIDTETTGLNPYKADLVGISLCADEHQAVYIPLQAKHEDDKQTKILTYQQVQDKLNNILQDKSVIKVGHNIKFDMHILQRHGFTINAFDDTMLMSYAIYGSSLRHSLESLAMHFLDHDMTSFKEVCGVGKKQITFDHVVLDKACHYAAEDAHFTFKLYNILYPQLVEYKKSHIYYNIDRPLIKSVLAIEKNGFKIDTKKLQSLSVELAKIISDTEQEAYILAGEEFNLASPKQVANILYDKLAIKGGKKTPTGGYSTNAATLEILSGQGYEIAKILLEWRGAAKLKSTYSDVLPTLVDNKNRIHTNLLLTATSTGRLASNEPNLQNIPIRTKAGRKIREAFICDDGNVLLCADFSQIELRLLAIIADIKTMKEVFHKGEDIHTMTAAEIYGLDKNQVTQEQRRSAKSINFGIIYGISAFGLAAQLAITRKQASIIIKSYFEKFPGIEKYMQDTIAFTKANGYVLTLDGRKIEFASINSNNYSIRSAAERAAINAPIQGSAADIMRRSLNCVYYYLQEKHPDCKLLLQIHDELVIECHKSKVDEISQQVKRIMEQEATKFLQTSIPLSVDCGYGLNWEEAH